MYDITGYVTLFMELMMRSKTERFELRLEQKMLDRLDDWSGHHGSGASRAEAARRLMEIGLQQFGENRVQISDGEKLIMTMLRDIYRGLDIKNGEVDPDFILSALVGGHYWALAWEYDGILHSQQNREHIVYEVVNVLDMWSFLETGYKRLSEEEKEHIAQELDPFGKNILFPGFDGNNETGHFSIARFLVDEMNRFESFKGRELNSHSECLDGYRRMLVTFEPMRSKLTGGDLSVSQIITILKAREY